MPRATATRGPTTTSGVYARLILFFFSSRRRHTRLDCDWSSDVCSSDLVVIADDLPVMREGLARLIGDECDLVVAGSAASGTELRTLMTQQPPRVLVMDRSEEHTSELQSQSNLVCRLLLEKKKHRI